MAHKRHDTDTLEMTGSAQHEAWLVDDVPPPEELRPGLWSIPLPIPIPALRYVICYAFVSSSGLVLVDPGWDDDDCWNALQAALATIGTSAEATSLVLATHFHFDHLGLASRVRQASGAPIALHERDVARLASNRQLALGGRPRAQELIDRLGIPSDGLDQLVTGWFDYRHLDPDSIDIVLGDGDLAPMPDWKLRSFWTPGHSPGHLCYFDEANGLLLSGDHVLPRITPNVSMQLLDAAPDDDPLSDYMSSLGKITGVPAVEVLPAHLWRFRRLDVRLEELLSHHEERLEELREVVSRSGVTAWQAAQLLTWSRAWETFNNGSKRSALGETLSHLRTLETRGAIRRVTGSPDRWMPQ